MADTLPDAPFSHLPPDEQEGRRRAREMVLEALLEVDLPHAQRVQLAAALKRHGAI